VAVAIALAMAVAIIDSLLLCPPVLTSTSLNSTDEEADANAKDWC
jgi:hypothetical protein